MHTEIIDELLESEDERRARYKRLAIAAAAAAARAPIASVRTAYMIIAESWSNLAHSAELQDTEKLYHARLDLTEHPGSSEADEAPSGANPHAISA
ncbi:MAG TPA: hypothetical protein VHT51_03880 [Micropepsaceae bacterium]|jgi:hypothetical protein|nr:hypothetical protein [Micropepsaceae bacterium]